MIQPKLYYDPRIYHGIRHAVTDDEDIHVLNIDLRNPHLRMMPVLASRDGIECNSVNHSDKDLSSNCDPLYPFETLPSMLGRYIGIGGVAMINTDYFGPDGDHGAQGLVVKNGIRLDGPEHGADNALAYTTPSLAISPSNKTIIGIPPSQVAIENGLSDQYYNTAAGAPMLVENHQVITDQEQHPSPAYAKNFCHELAQSAAGLTDDDHLILVTAKTDAFTLAQFLVDHFAVHTAFKFDGGRSASMVWLDGAGEIQAYYPENVEREIAAGLLIISQKK